MPPKAENFNDPNIPRIIVRKPENKYYPGGIVVQKVSVESNKLEEFSRFRPKNSDFLKLDDSSWLRDIGQRGLEHRLYCDYMDWTLRKNKSFSSLGSRFEELFPENITQDELALAKQKFFLEDHPMGSLGLFDEWFKGSGLPDEFRITILKELFEV